MQSHPESSVPRALLIPRSCACLRPFPLTLSAYLGEQEVRYKMVAGDRNCKAFRWNSVPQTFGCEVTWVHGLLRCDRVCVSGGGRTREARFCLFSSLHFRWLNISSVAPRPVPDIPLHFPPLSQWPLYGITLDRDMVHSSNSTENTRGWTKFVF